MLQKFARYASLNVLSMIAMSCYFLADTFFISKACGPDGLTALNLALPAFNFMNGIGLMLGMGGATKYAVYKAGRNDHEANRAFSQTIWTALAVGVLFMLISLLWSAPLTRLMGADAQVYDMTHTYLKFILLFSPAFALNDVMTAIVRNDGAPRLASFAVIAGSLANILGDYLLIFPCHMGILGAVLATCSSPIISLLIMLSYIIRKKNGFHFVAGYEWRLTGSICGIGFPSFISEFASGLVMYIFNYLILRLTGNIGVAAYGIIANISYVAIYLVTGVAQGMQPLVSESYGQGNEKAMRTYLRYALISMAGISVATYLLLLFCADPIAAVFNSHHNAEMQALAVTGLKLYFIGIPFAGFNIVMAMYFTSGERAVPGQIIQLARAVFVIIPVAFLMAHVLGMNGVWLTFPTAEAVVALISLGLAAGVHQKGGKAESLSGNVKG